MKMPSIVWPFVICLLALTQLPSGSASISCYVCNSHNYSDPHCDDPMSPAYMKLETNCKVPKENHIGEFPANFCVKMIGTKFSNGEQLVIRTCVLEDMNSQCGTFRFENETLKGCILTCDYDGCNAAMGTNTFGILALIIVITLTLNLS